MYSKEEVMREIGEENWEAFDNFMCDKEAEFDENGLEIYYVGYVQEFKSNL